MTKFLIQCKKCSAINGKPRYFHDEWMNVAANDVCLLTQSTMFDLYEWFLDIHIPTKRPFIIQLSITRTRRREGEGMLAINPLPTRR